jgi:hypothetical protein
VAKPGRFSSNSTIKGSSIIKALNHSAIEALKIDELTVFTVAFANSDMRFASRQELLVKSPCYLRSVKIFSVCIAWFQDVP